jgi:hypothetical protein
MRHWRRGRSSPEADAEAPWAKRFSPPHSTPHSGDVRGLCVQPVNLQNEGTIHEHLRVAFSEASVACSSQLASCIVLRSASRIMPLAVCSRLRSCVRTGSAANSASFKLQTRTPKSPIPRYYSRSPHSRFGRRGVGAGVRGAGAGTPDSAEIGSQGIPDSIRESGNPRFGWERELGSRRRRAGDLGVWL